MSESIETRLRRLEAIEEIKSLKAHYAFLCDNGGSPDELASMFAADGTWRGDRGFAAGKHTGHDALREFYRKNALERVSWAIHFVIAPRIEISEDFTTARGTWYLWQPSTVVGHGDHWVSGWYEDEFVFEEGRWKFADMFLRFATIAEYGKGWEGAAYGAWSSDEPLTWQDR